jgi:hypothetical protein
MISAAPSLQVLHGAPEPPVAPVSIAKCATYDEDVTAKMAAMFGQLGGLEKLVRNKTVTIKVNMTGAPGQRFQGLALGLTHYTHPKVVGAQAAVRAVHHGDGPRLPVSQPAVERRAQHVGEGDLEGCVAVPPGVRRPGLPHAEPSGDKKIKADQAKPGSPQSANTSQDCAKMSGKDKDKCIQATPAGAVNTNTGEGNKVKSETAKDRDRATAESQTDGNANNIPAQSNDTVGHPEERTPTGEGQTLRERGETVSAIDGIGGVGAIRLVESIAADSTAACRSLLPSPASRGYRPAGCRDGNQWSNGNQRSE